MKTLKNPKTGKPIPTNKIINLEGVEVTIMPDELLVLSIALCFLDRVNERDPDFVAHAGNALEAMRNSPAFGSVHDKLHQEQ